MSGVTNARLYLTIRVPGHHHYIYIMDIVYYVFKTDIVAGSAGRKDIIQ